MALWRCLKCISQEKKFSIAVVITVSRRVVLACSGYIKSDTFTSSKYHLFFCNKHTDPRGVPTADGFGPRSFTTLFAETLRKNTLLRST